PNLYGDILSDVAAEITGSVGLAPSANIGTIGAMFEAIHGSAPRRAGQNVANPSGLLLASVMMMAYLGEAEIATRIHEAWLVTIEEGIHTYDISNDQTTRRRVSTQEFSEAIVKNLGNKPKQLKAPIYKARTKIVPILSPHETKTKRELVGVDIYIYSKDKAPAFEQKITKLSTTTLKLKMISNRGARIWPNGHSETFCIEQWRCRYIAPDGKSTQPHEILKLLDTLTLSGYDVIKTENLYMFDGQPGYSSAEG
ncbi:MAG: isocitrate/isopropylmalate family dehydrogenase, partial [Rhabdochlamydiaceae bacterium]